MGGALTLLGATQAPELDAAVVWYGCPPLDYIDASKIKIPLQGHWATQDQFFKIEIVDGLEEKLKARAWTLNSTATWPTTRLRTKPP